MHATATLTIEHRVMDRALAALEGLVEEVALSGKDAREDLGRVIGLLWSYAEEIHQPKEVGILLAHLLETGLPAARGPIAAMLADHASLRRAMSQLGVLAHQPEPWNTAAIECLEQATADLAVLLRGHMAQEEALLFELAERSLPPEATERIEAMFDAHATKTDTRARELSDLAATLVRRWAPFDEYPAPTERRSPSRRELASQQSLLFG